MSAYYTSAHIAEFSRDRRVAAEHAHLVRAARTTAAPRSRKVRVHVPRISFRAAPGVAARAVPGAA